MNTSRIFLGCTLALLLLGSVHGATFNIPDGDVAALKSAITTANSNREPDVIDLAANGTYTLTAIDNFASGANGLPVISNDSAGLDLTINGHGASIQRNDAPGAAQFRIIEIGDAAEASCNDLTISHGRGRGTFPTHAGGAIFVGHATLALTHCTFLENTAVTGGAIYNDGGLLNIRDTAFEDNFADAGPNGIDPAKGGAITNIGGGLALTGSTLHANRSDAQAGGIYSNGTIRLTNSALTENVASGAGGAIANDGEVALLASEVSGNRSDSVGGGIHSSKSLTLQRCAINGNQSASSGGGINNFGSLTVESSTFLDNIAGSRGGAISTFRNDPATAADATVRNSTFSNNLGIRGGALSNFAGALTLLNSTLSGNTAFVFGGAIHNMNGIATVRAVTFTGNSAKDNAGIFNHSIPAQPGPAPVLTIQNSIFQLGALGVNLLNAGGTIISDGFNLSDDPAGGDGSSGPGGFLSGQKDIRNVDPKLGPLQNNGGPTLTHALLSDSPAIEAGASVNVPESDQRGFARVGAHDIGAFEFEGVPPAVPLLRAVSRKTHGDAGMFDLSLALTGAATVESRNADGNGGHTVIFTFAEPIVSVGGASIEGSGTVSGTAVSADSREIAVELSGVADAQIITVTLANVRDSLGAISPAVGVAVGLLDGDSNGDGAVNSGDAQQTRNRSGQATDATNFRSDYNLDGTINSGDATVVRSRSGEFIP